MTPDFLIDTNCWMQLLRQRDHSDSVRTLFSTIPLNRLAISMFSVHSIGVILYRRGMIGAYADILKATSIGDEVSVVGLGISELARVQAACSELRLDFDDAYQYVVADVHQFKLVSLDADFDHTPNGRLMPVQAVERFSRFSDS